MKKLFSTIALCALLGACLCLGACSGGSSTPARPASGATAKAAPAAPAPGKAEPETPAAAPKPAGKPAEKPAETAVQPVEKAAVEQAQKPAEPPSEKPAAEPVRVPAPAGAGGAAAPAPLAPPSGDAPVVYVLLKTSLGEIVLELNRDKAPESVANFLQYVDSRFYHGTVFHRIMADFMIQGGGFDTSGQQKPTTQPPVANEWRNGLKNVRGSIAMARLGGKPDSATSQFFISVVDNAALDLARDGAAYAVFGRVYAGMSVVDSIRQVPVEGNERGESSKPLDPIVIEEARQITVQQAMNRAELEKQLSGK